MGYQTLALGLTLTIPTAGTRNWSQTLYSTTWTKISAHDHTGSGNGAQLGSNALLNLAVTTGKINDLAVTTAKIADQNVTTGKLADLSVTTAKLAALGVTTAKIADLNVTTGKLADAAVTSLKIADANVITAKIADANVTTAKIADFNVTAAKIANLTITGVKIAAQAITADKLAINLAQIQAGILTPTGTTQTIDWNTGMIHRLNLGSAAGDVALTFSFPAAGASYKIFITQGAVARKIVWPASVKWPQGQEPTLSTANGAIDSVFFYCDGTNYLGTWELNYS